MVSEDREAKKKSRMKRREAIEDAAAAADRELIMMASQTLAQVTEGGDGNSSSNTLTTTLDSTLDEKETSKKSTTTTSAPTANAAAAAFQAPNVFFQRAEDDSLVSKLGGGSNIVGGVDASQVPPLCKKWVMLACPLPSGECSHRHYYTSKEEKARGVTKRQSVDAKLERRVVEALTQREDTLRLIHRAAADATRKFMDHTDADVREKDVKNLLNLLSQMRIATVEAIEAIVAWREAVAEQRMKMKLNGEEDEEDDPSDKSEEAERRRRKKKEKIKEDQLKIKFVGGSRTTPWKKNTPKVPPKKDVGMVTTEPIKYSVKIAVEGDQLYGGTAPYKALLKRFNRDRTLPKKAVNWVFLGVCDTEAEAALLYDKARTEQAVLHATTAERMPKRRTYIRRCGHYAVESVDCGAPKSRCEICYVNSMDNSSNLTVPFLWNGMLLLSFLEKILFLLLLYYFFLILKTMI
jgi:hypothetical protein